jgi:hypothetical protein
LYFEIRSYLNKKYIRKGTKKFVYATKNQIISYVLSEPTFRMKNYSTNLLNQNLELVSLSPKEKEDLVQKIQKPNGK